MSVNTQTPLEPRKYQYIDVMRGIAIILVVVAHTILPDKGNALLFDISSFCQMGVQLFFVASALTLYLSMSSRGLSRQELISFYLRRFFRIAPLYYFGIILYYFLTKLDFPSKNPFGDDYNFINVAANFLLVHGVYPPAINNIVPGGWSIGCEFLFYLIFPFIFVRIDSKNKAIAFIILSFISNIFVQIAICVLQHKPFFIINNSFAYLFIFNQLPVFGCGILLYFLIQETNCAAGQLLPAAWNNFWKACAFAALTIGVWKSRELLGFGFAFAFVPTISAMAFLFLGLFLSRLPMGNQISNFIAEVGRKSFSIYIFHFIFAWSITPFIAEILTNNFSISLYIIFIISISLTLLSTYILSIFSNVYIENKGISMGRRAIEILKTRSLSRQ